MRSRILAHLRSPRRLRWSWRFSERNNEGHDPLFAYFEEGLYWSTWPQRCPKVSALPYPHMECSHANDERFAENKQPARGMAHNAIHTHINSPHPFMWWFLQILQREEEGLHFAEFTSFTARAAARRQDKKYIIVIINKQFLPRLVDSRKKKLKGEFTFSLIIL